METPSGITGAKGSARSESGRVFVEFVIVIPLFLAISLGTADFSRILTYLSQLNSKVSAVGREVSVEALDCPSLEALALTNTTQSLSNLSSVGTVTNITAMTVIPPVPNPPPPAHSGYAQHRTLEIVVQSDVKCISCQLFLLGSYSTISFERRFRFSVEREDLCRV